MANGDAVPAALVTGERGLDGGCSVGFTTPPVLCWRADTPLVSWHPCTAQSVNSFASELCQIQLVLSWDACDVADTARPLIPHISAAQWQANCEKRCHSRQQNKPQAQSDKHKYTCSAITACQHSHLQAMGGMHASSATQHILVCLMHAHTCACTPASQCQNISSASSHQAVDCTV